LVTDQQHWPPSTNWPLANIIVCSPPHAHEHDCSSEQTFRDVAHTIEDLDAYASRLINSTSVPALPVDPTEMFYDKPGPFHDTVNPEASFDIIALGAWYSREDHELVSLLQLRPTGGERQRPAAASGDQQLPPEPDCDSFWTAMTGYVSESSTLLPARFKAVRTAITSWRYHGSLGGFYPLFSTNTVTSRSGGGRGASADCEAIISAVDTSLISANTDMYTVVYDPDMHLKPQDVPASRIKFTNMSTSKLGAIVPPQGPRTPRNHAQATSLPEASFWKIATDKEMTSIEELNVMAYGQPPRGAAIIGSMFVYKIKMNPDGTIEKYKVRLVALGNHQKYGETFSETYAPGTQLSSSRLILYLALKMKLELKHMDVRTAYLQSKLTRDHDDIWVRLPAGFKSKSGDVYGKLLRPLYGVRQAGREWYFTNREFIMNQDPRWKQSSVEAQIYYAIDSETNLFCVILVHTDDYFGVCSDDKFWKKFVTDMQKRFDTDVKDECTSMLQMAVERKYDTFEIHQRRQIEDIIDEFGEDTTMKTVDSPMEKGLNLPSDTVLDPKLRYRALIGALLWIARCTRPDILFVIIYLSRFSNCATKIHWDALIRVLRYLKTTIETPFVLSVIEKTPSCRSTSSTRPSSSACSTSSCNSSWSSTRTATTCSSTRPPSTRSSTSSCNIYLMAITSRCNIHLMVNIEHVLIHYVLIIQHGHHPLRADQRGRLPQVGPSASTSGVTISGVLTA
jgi:hypothetical protein